MIGDKSIPEEVEIKPLNEFGCINADCREHGERGRNNLRVHQTKASQIPSGFSNVKSVARDFQNVPTQPYREVGFPKSRSLRFFITWRRDADSDRFVVWWASVEMRWVA